MSQLVQQNNITDLIKSQMPAIALVMNGTSERERKIKAERFARICLPSPAVVFPFSTFAEVAQPAHKVVFRLQSSPLACKLIECDGGAWKLEAIANIRTWLIENLPEVVKVIA